MCPVRLPRHFIGSAAAIERFVGPRQGIARRRALLVVDDYSHAILRVVIAHKFVRVVLVIVARRRIAASPLRSRRTRPARPAPRVSSPYV